MNKLQEAKRYIRGEGWKISGTAASGYTVEQNSMSHRFDVEGLLRFGGQDMSLEVEQFKLPDNFDIADYANCGGCFCIGCGQPDEPDLHDPKMHAAVIEGKHSCEHEDRSAVLIDGEPAAVCQDCNRVYDHPHFEAMIRGDPTMRLLREAMVKLRVCQGQPVSADYACNLIERIEQHIAAEGQP